ncbi:hypothetical protein CEXT_743611 [Caerostris extrusa]|uniref:Uncharacterized protein n=1 Tax=Caerostris extrusa TaxID=172846 RepID=A0AAV4MBA2_CAEEX|nr:hypothetical protein CEXT_743611 [Caerostris extrusa]
MACPRPVIHLSRNRLGIGWHSSWSPVSADSSLTRVGWAREEQSIKNWMTFLAVTHLKNHREAITIILGQQDREFFFNKTECLWDF